MIRYEFTQPADELENEAVAMKASLTLDTEDPEVWVDIRYDGAPELIERIRSHLQESCGLRARPMDDTRTRPCDLVHAIHGSGQLDDYEPRRTVDTVDWTKGDAT